jgi:hypothetical protein
MRDAPLAYMATKIYPSDDGGGPLELKTRGPTWTFYLLTVLAVLVAVSTYLGFRLASIAP